MDSIKRVALVTGSGRGIDRAIALGLAKGGARAVVNYHSRQPAAEKVARKQNLKGKR